MKTGITIRSIQTAMVLTCLSFFSASAFAQSKLDQVLEAQLPHIEYHAVTDEDCAIREYLKDYIDFTRLFFIDGTWSNELRTTICDKANGISEGIQSAAQFDEIQRKAGRRSEVYSYQLQSGRKEIVSFIKEEMDESQFSELKAAHFRLQMYSKGLPHLLLETDEPISNALAISEQERKRVFQRLERLNDEIEAKIRELEQYYVEQITNELDGESRKAVKSIYESGKFTTPTDLPKLLKTIQAPNVSDRSELVDN